MTIHEISDRLSHECTDANDTASTSDRDPLHVYKVYKEKRPSSMTVPDSPLYLSINHFNQFQALKKGVQWFNPDAMGINKLNIIMKMKEMIEAAGIQDKTNHSGRKTLVQKPQENDIPPNQIVQIIGHNNLQLVKEELQFLSQIIYEIKHITNHRNNTQLQFSPREADGKHLTLSIFNIKNGVNDYYEYYG